MTRDAALGAITLGLAAGYYAMASAIPESLIADAVGPARLPKTYAAMLAGLSVILIAKSLVRRRLASGESNARDGRDSTRAWRPAGLLAIGVVYILIVPWLGYVLSIAALLLATTYFQGGVLNRRVAAVAGVGALLFWALFVLLLRIPQPSGFWPGLS